MAETEVQIAFVEHLREHGWDVSTENPDYTDVVAERGTKRIIAEVKGHTSSPGTDVDTMYGQLLHRMGQAESECGTTRYAIVLPRSLRKSLCAFRREYEQPWTSTYGRWTSRVLCSETPKPHGPEIRGDHPPEAGLG